MTTNLGGFAELTLQARDIAGLEHFYMQVLGLEVIGREDDRVWLRVGECARLGLWTPGEKEFGDEGGDRSLYLEDPEGNVVEFWDRYMRKTP